MYNQEFDQNCDLDTVSESSDNLIVLNEIDFDILYDIHKDIFERFGYFTALFAKFNDFITYGNEHKMLSLTHNELDKFKEYYNHELKVSYSVLQKYFNYISKENWDVFCLSEIL